MLYNLEALRGVCAVMVAVVHVPWATHLHASPFIQNAWLFVDFFFVLSGFIIAFNYASPGSTRFDWCNFIIKRFFRLYPLHLVTALIFLILVLGKQFVLPSFTPILPRGELPDTFGFALIANLLMLHSMGLVPYAILNAPSWSISAEFYTYCVFALCCTAVRRPHARVALMGIIGLAAFLILLSLNGGRGLWTTFEYGILRCLACFGFGTLVWLMSAIWPLRLPGFLLDLCYAAIVVALYMLMGVVSQNTPLNITAPLFFGLIIYLCAIDYGSLTKRMLDTAPLRALGRWSYSIYMVHFMIATGMGVLLEYIWPSRLDVGQITSLIAIPADAGDLLCVVYLALTILFSASSYALIEEPWRAVGRRLLAGSASAAFVKHADGRT